MATRKKKIDVIMSADIAEMINPKVVKGNHLTVTTFPNGKTMLQWDDEALLKEVREALKSVEVQKTKTKRKLTKEKQ
jgi:hypothetical protein